MSEEAPAYPNMSGSSVMGEKSPGLLDVLADDDSGLEVATRPILSRKIQRQDGKLR